MDRISHLPDELLKIFSFNPTKDVLRTMLLSRRFKSLWMLVPKLEFDNGTHFPETISRGALLLQPDYRIFRQFVDRSLMSFEGQFLQSLSLKLGPECTYGDVAIWVRTAMKRGLVELKLAYHSSCGRRYLPKSIYTCCETLVVLELEQVGLDVPDIVSLRSLKTLSLKHMRYSKASSLIRLLSKCPVLEDLFLQNIQYPYKSSLLFMIAVPSLKRLSLLDSSRNSQIPGLVIDAPSLKYLHIVDRFGHLSFSERININKLVKADIDVTLSEPAKILHSLVSVKHIRLCLSASEVVYPVDICFNRLKHLEVCTCKSDWMDLFMHLLQDSPNLKVIKINKCHGHVMNSWPHSWNQPGSVPVCLSSNLETLDWINYEGTNGEKELATYILKTAASLKKASFIARSDDTMKKLQMLQELALSRRVSTTCELVFD